MKTTRHALMIDVLLKGIGCIPSVCAMVVLLALTSCTTDRPSESALTTDRLKSSRLTTSVMRHKLVYAHNILEALTLEDYDTIERDANRLTDVSLESDWHIHDTPSYGVFSERFRASTRALAEQAREGNFTVVSEAYADMMQACHACHQYLRAEGLYREMPGRISWKKGDRLLFKMAFRSHP